MIVLNLVTLPCDCVADASTILVSKDALECPWCGSTFSSEEYACWVDDEHRPVRFAATYPLIVFGNALYEVVGRCVDDGCPLVRDHRGNFTREVAHLRVPTDQIALLRD